MLNTRIDDIQSLRSPFGAPSRWSSLARFGLAVSAGYCAFVWIPWTLSFLSLAHWPFTALAAVGRWPITHVFRLPEHFVPSAWAANFLPHYLAAAVVAIGMSILAAAWIAIDRRAANYSRAFAWLHRIVRYMLGTILLMYGWHKILPGQFGRFAAGAGTDYLIHQVGQLPPRDLLWAFMEASRTYQVFTGVVEALSGLLLFSPSTAPFGALLALASLTNVFVVDVGYDVNVKFFAGQLLLMSLLVLVPYVRPLIKQLRALMARGSGRERRLSAVVALVAIVFTFRGAQRTVDDNRAIRETPLHGIWDVEQVTRNGTPVPLLVTDSTLWRRLVFPFKGTQSAAIIVWMSDAVTRFTSTIDIAASRIDLSPIRGNAVAGSIRGLAGSDSGERQSFTFTLEDQNHLVLMKSASGGGFQVIRLRRFDPAEYRLLAHKVEWRW